MRLLKILLVLILICLLTAVTQIGGLVFLISLLTFGLIDKRLNKRWARMTAKMLSFTTLYLTFVFVVVPLTAKSFGRVQLPVFENRHLKPANIWTCLLNRNYVRPQLREITYKVAERMNKMYPGITINYLDANFPFINKFPLLPHLSHNDGKKLDISFQYNDSRTGQLTNDIPSFIGYGICEEPKAGEENKPVYCDEKGYWQYNLLRNIVSQDNKAKFTFDNKRTKELVSSFALHEGLGKIFIEPHLKTRLGLTSSKIRFHGCQAVRHDDHIHVQLK
jgi:energy-coupling factor transporter transmembrane protein EcfT